jgi:glycosyltransferase involved in cell wall biosynthesis
MRNRDWRFYCRWNASNAKDALLSFARGSRPAPWYWDDLDPLRRIDQMERTACTQADLIASPCQALSDWVIENWDIPSEKIKLSPYPYIPHPDYLAITPSPEGFVGHEPVVGFVGRMDRKKGIETFRKIIPLVVREYPKVRFRFVGTISKQFGTDIPYDRWLNEALPTYRSNIEFLGKVPLDQIAHAYSLMDVCVFPSLWENFPNVCLEAMSAARAIVGSTQGGMPEMLNHGECGFLASPFDASQIASKINTFLSDAKLRSDKGILARKRILSEYSAGVIGQQIENVFACVTP